MLSSEKKAAEVGGSSLLLNCHSTTSYDFQSWQSVAPIWNKKAVTKIYTWFFRINTSASNIMMSLERPSSSLSGELTACNHVMFIPSLTLKKSKNWLRESWCFVGLHVLFCPWSASEHKKTGTPETEEQHVWDQQPIPYYLKSNGYVTRNFFVSLVKLSLSPSFCFSGPIFRFRHAIVWSRVLRWAIWSNTFREKKSRTQISNHFSCKPNESPFVSIKTFKLNCLICKLN